jgi:hypothetical protein
MRLAESTRAVGVQRNDDAKSHRIPGLEVIVFDQTKASVDANNVSMDTRSPLDLTLNDVAATRLPHRASNVARNAGVLGDAPKRNDRQVLPAAMMLDDQLDHRAWSSSNERVRSRARRSPWPTRSPGAAMNGTSLDSALRESTVLTKRIAVPQSPPTHFGLELRYAWGAKPLEIRTRRFG